MTIQDIDTYKIKAASSEERALAASVLGHAAVGCLLLPQLSNVRWSQKNCVNCCRFPGQKQSRWSASGACWREWGIMQWNSFRKKLKVSSSSSLTNPPASRTVVGSNSPDGFKTHQQFLWQIFSPVFPAAPHSSNDVTHSTSRNTHPL